MQNPAELETWDATTVDCPMMVVVYVRNQTTNFQLTFADEQTTAVNVDFCAIVWERVKT